MVDIDKRAQEMLGDVCCDEDAARAYGGGCWNGFLDHVSGQSGGMQQGSRMLRFFFQDRFVTEMGHGVHMRGREG